MNTEQNYVGRGDNATSSTQTAQNDGQTPPSVDNRQPTQLSPAFVGDMAEISLSVWEFGDGKLSEAALVYWALEQSKQTYRKQIADDSADFEAADYNQTKLQEIQNTLFDSVCLLASKLSMSANGISYDHE
ncbi:hypothetical protein [Spirosoma litoris]